MHVVGHVWEPWAPCVHVPVRRQGGRRGSALHHQSNPCSLLPATAYTLPTAHCSLLPATAYTLPTAHCPGPSPLMMASSILSTLLHGRDLHAYPICRTNVMSSTSLTSETLLMSNPIYLHLLTESLLSLGCADASPLYQHHFALVTHGVALIGAWLVDSTGRTGNLPFKGAEGEAT